MKKIIQYVLAAVMILGIIGAIVYSKYSQYVPENPPDTVGNSAGNLYNGGLFAESDKYVFFSNPYDHNALYRMLPNETEIMKLSKSQAYMLNAAGDLVFYYQSLADANMDFTTAIFKTSGIYRIDSEGNRADCIKRCNVPAMQMIGNRIYFQDYATKTGTHLKSISVFGKDEKDIADTAINPSCMIGTTIYYQGTGNDHYLRTLNAESGFSAPIYPHNCYMPQNRGNYIYFIDVEQGYHISRFNLSDKSVEELVPEYCELYNLSDDYIYYQTGKTDSPALKRVPINGGEAEIVSPGVYQNINVTSKYVYFNAFDEPAPVYKVPANGMLQLGTFSAAAKVVAQAEED
ncbi:MAG: DUF5050 domain-containing protein [Lachnospiraceae bacterium]|nr:DUF5050 domain-containing protein [Lachnospiraceae bacterium]